MEQTIDGVSHQELVRIMQGLGYKAETLRETDMVIRSAAAGFTFLVFLYKLNDDAPRFDSLRFWMGFNDVQYSPDQANVWNDGWRYSKAVVDEEGNPTLEWDVLLSGVTPGYLRRCFAIWEMSMEKFAEHC